MWNSSNPDGILLGWFCLLKKAEYPPSWLALLSEVEDREQRRL